ncbi:hypothetical protein ACF0H5_012762 [Mactra antiquata]
MKLFLVLILTVCDLRTSFGQGGFRVPSLTDILTDTSNHLHRRPITDLQPSPDDGGSPIDIAGTNPDMGVPTNDGFIDINVASQGVPLGDGFTNIGGPNQGVPLSDGFISVDGSSQIFPQLEQGNLGSSNVGVFPDGFMEPASNSPFEPTQSSAIDSARDIFVALPGSEPNLAQSTSLSHSHETLGSTVSDHHHSSNTHQQPPLDHHQDTSAPVDTHAHHGTSSDNHHSSTIPVATNDIFGNNADPSNIPITDIHGNQAPHPTGLHVDLPGDHGNNNDFAVVHFGEAPIGSDIGMIDFNTGPPSVNPGTEIGLPGSDVPTVDIHLDNTNFPVLSEDISGAKTIDRIDQNGPAMSNSDGIFHASNVHNLQQNEMFPTSGTGFDDLQSNPGLSLGPIIQTDIPLITTGLTDTVPIRNPISLSDVTPFPPDNIVSVDTAVDPNIPTFTDTGVNPSIPAFTDTGVNPNVPAFTDTGVIPNVPAYTDTGVNHNIPAFTDTGVNPNVPAFTDTGVIPNVPAFTDTGVNPNIPAFTDTGVNPNVPAFTDTGVNPNIPAFTDTVNPNIPIIIGATDIFTDTQVGQGPIDTTHNVFHASNVHFVDSNNVFQRPGFDDLAASDQFNGRFHTGSSDNLVPDPNSHVFNPAVTDIHQPIHISPTNDGLIIPDSVAPINDRFVPIASLPAAGPTIGNTVPTKEQTVPQLAKQPPVLIESPHNQQMHPVSEHVNTIDGAHTGISQGTPLGGVLLDKPTLPVFTDPIPDIPQGHIEAHLPVNTVPVGPIIDHSIDVHQQVKPLPSGDVIIQQSLPEVHPVIPDTKPVIPITHVPVESTAVNPDIQHQGIVHPETPKLHGKPDIGIPHHQIVPATKPNTGGHKSITHSLIELGNAIKRHRSQSNRGQRYVGRRRGTVVPTGVLRGSSNVAVPPRRDIVKPRESLGDFLGIPSGTLPTRSNTRSEVSIGTRVGHEHVSPRVVKSEGSLGEFLGIPSVVLPVQPSAIASARAGSTGASASASIGHRGQNIHIHNTAVAGHSPSSHRFVIRPSSRNPFRQLGSVIRSTLTTGGPKGGGLLGSLVNTALKTITGRVGAPRPVRVTSHGVRSVRRPVLSFPTSYDGALHADFLANQIADLLRNNRALEASVFGASPMADISGPPLPHDAARSGNAELPHGGASGGIRLGSTVPGASASSGGPQGAFIPVDIPIETPRQEVSTGLFGPGVRRRPHPALNSMTSVGVGNPSSLPPVSLPGQALFGGGVPAMPSDTALNIPGQNAVFTDVSLSANPLSVITGGSNIQPGHGQSEPFHVSQGNNVHSQGQGDIINHGTPLGTPLGQAQFELPIQHGTPIRGTPGLPLGDANDPHGPHDSSGGALLGSVHVDLPGEHGNPLDGTPVIHRVDHHPGEHSPHDGTPIGGRLGVHQVANHLGLSTSHDISHQGSSHGTPLRLIPIDLPVHHDTSISGDPGLPLGGSHQTHGPHDSSGGTLLGSVHVDLPGEHGNPLDGTPVIHRVDHHQGEHSPHDALPPGSTSGLPVDHIPVELPVQHGTSIGGTAGLPLGGSHDQHGPHASSGGALLGSVHVDLPGEHGNPLDGTPVIHRVDHHQGEHSPHDALPPGSTSGLPVDHMPIELPVQHGSPIVGTPGLPLGGSHDTHGPHDSSGGALLGSVHIDLPGEHGNPKDGVPVIHRENHPPGKHLPGVSQGTPLRKVKAVDHPVHHESMHQEIHPLLGTGTVNVSPLSLHGSSNAGLPMESSLGQIHSDIPTLNIDVHHGVHPKRLETTGSGLHVSPDVISHDPVGIRHQTKPIVDPIVAVQTKRLGEMLGIPFSIFESPPTESQEIGNRPVRRIGGRRGRGRGGRRWRGSDRGRGGYGRRRGDQRGRGGQRGRGALLNSIVQTAIGTAGPRGYGRARGPAMRGRGRFQG